jgi:ketosteroid isomerase-like protein
MQHKEAQSMATDFQDFLETRKQAALGYVNGDYEPLSRIVATKSPASFFSPMGDVVEGAEKVAARYEKDANSFDEGSTSELDIVSSGSDGDFGYWVGYQKAKVHMKGKPDAVPMKIRITELFRKEHGDWKMIHRHADMPQPKKD